MTGVDVARARSWLFVPASTPHRFAGAVRSGADAVIVDLEDAVAVDDKEAARRNVAAWLAGDGAAWVRINADDTAWHEEDVAMLRELPGLLGLVVPKAEDPDRLGRIAARLQPHGCLVALVETARGIQRAAGIASVPGVERLAFGSLDFALDVRAEHEDQSLLMARSSLVLASRAEELPPPIDGVTTAVRDVAATEADARRALALGFGGKLCVHPAQVEAVARAFAPTTDELAWARAVVKAAERAAGSVVVGPDGHMIDQPVVDRATAILER
jgi:citrate lyase subunit beta/citryl-CoA lyase